MVTVHVASGTRNILVFWAAWPRPWATPYTKTASQPLLFLITSDNTIHDNARGRDMMTEEILLSLTWTTLRVQIPPDRRICLDGRTCLGRKI
jgi:hypothetical protein